MYRTEIAYLLIVVMIATLAAIIVYLRYHSRERTHRRRVRRERGEYAERMKAKEQEAGLRP